MATILGANIYIDGVKHNANPVGTVNGLDVDITGYDFSSAVAPDTDFTAEFTIVYDNGFETAKSTLQNLTSGTGGDVTAPTIASATIEDANPDQLVVVFSESVNATGVTGLTITGDETPAVSSVLSGSGTSTVNFQLGASVSAGSSLTLNVAGTNDIADLAGNPLAATTQSIANNVAPAVTPILDTYTGAFFAVSFRKLRSAYSGPCIQVKAGGVTQDIGFDGDYLNITALNTFVGSNDYKITVMYDQSGNGRNWNVLTVDVEPNIGLAGALNTYNGKVGLQSPTSAHRLRTGTFSNLSNATDILVIEENTNNDITVIANAGDNNNYSGALASNPTYASSEVITSGITTPSITVNGTTFNGTTRGDLAPLVRNGGGTIYTTTGGFASWSTLQNNFHPGSGVLFPVNNIFERIVYPSVRADLGDITTAINSYYSFY